MFYATIFLIEVNIICIWFLPPQLWKQVKPLSIITCQRWTQGKDCHEPIVEEPINLSQTESTTPNKKERTT
jgi:hypothetical protein